MAEKVQGLRSTNWQVQNRLGDIKNTVGNGVAKECICMTHGHELSGGLLEGMGGVQWKRAMGKNWDNCNCIINKIYFLNVAQL